MNSFSLTLYSKQRLYLFFHPFSFSWPWFSPFLCLKGATLFFFLFLFLVCCLYFFLHHLVVVTYTFLLKHDPLFFPNSFTLFSIVYCLFFYWIDALKHNFCSLQTLLDKTKWVGDTWEMQGWQWSTSHDRIFKVFFFFFFPFPTKISFYYSRLFCYH